MKNPRIALGAVLILGMLVAGGCGSEVKQGVVVDFGQSVPAGGGMVQSFVVVESDGGDEITVWLPNDDGVWNSMMSAARSSNRTVIEFEKDGDFWMYVDVADSMDEPPATLAAEAGEYGEPEVSGQLAPMPVGSSVDSAVTDDSAPTVVGQDFNGNEVRIENDGRAKAIVLLAHWCPHCQNEVPAVQAWLETGGSVEGVDMYSIATATDTSRDNYPPSEWLDREGWTVPVIRDDSNNSVHTAYGSGGFPFWVFVNSDGTVAARISGSTAIEDLEQVMLSLY